MHWLKGALLVALTLWGWCVSSNAAAQQCSARLVVGAFRGPEANRVRMAVISGLSRRGCVLVEQQELALEPGERASDAQLQQQAKRAGVDWVIQGTIARKRRIWAVTFSLVSSFGVDVKESLNISSRRRIDLAPSTKRTVWRRLREFLAQTAPSSQAQAAAKGEGSKTPSSSQLEIGEIQVRADPSTKGESETTLSAPEGQSGKDAKRIVVVRGENAENTAEYLKQVLSAHGHDAVVGDVPEDFDLADAPGVMALMEQHQADALVLVQIGKSRRRTTVTATLYNAQDGAVLLELRESVRLVRKIRSVVDGFVQSMTEPLLRAQRKIELAPVVVVTPTPVKKIEARHQGLRYPTLSVSLGVSLVGRDFWYKDDLFEALRKYKIFPAGALSLQAEWFPASHWTDEWFVHLGVGFKAVASTGINSSTEGSDAGYPTSLHEGLMYFVGRFPISESLWLRSTFGYARQAFFINDLDVETKKPEIPSVEYQGMHARLGSRWSPMNSLWVGGNVGYRFVLGAGEIATLAYFPRMSIGGFDVNAFARYFIWESFGVQLDLDFVRYFMQMNPEPGDPNIAGGAVDHYFGGTLSLLYQLGGVNN